MAEEVTEQTDMGALIATATAMREQLGDAYPKSGSILDLWLRTASALERSQAELQQERERADDLKILAGAAAGFRRTVQGDAGVEYRARATTGHVYGDVRITPEFAVAAYEEALDRETFEQDDETPVVETRRVGPWLPVEQGDDLKILAAGRVEAWRLTEALAALSRAEETIEKVRDVLGGLYLLPSPSGEVALSIITEYDKQKEADRG